MIGIDALAQRPDFEIGCEMQKKWHRISGNMAALGRWIDDAVRCRWQAIVRQSLEHIPHIDHHCPFGWIHGKPIARLRQELKARLFSPKEQSDQVDIFMSPSPNTVCVARDWRIVEEAQDRIAILNRRFEPVRCKPKISGDGREQLVSSRIERSKYRLERLPETGNFGWPNVVRHVVVESVSRRQVTADMPEFFQIMFVGIFGHLDAERRVTPGAARAVKDIAGLGFNRQRKEFTRKIPGLCDQGGINAMIGDYSETEGQEGPA